MATWYHLPTGEAIWTVIPTQTITHQPLIDHLRPMRSAIGAAMRAPIRVPIDNYSLSVSDIGLKIMKDDNGTDQTNNQP